MAGKGVVLRDADSAPPVGIDLGTTYSVIGVYRAGRTEIIANDSGSRTTPSVVAFSGKTRYVGEAATDLPARSRVFDAKRMLGRSFNDTEIQTDMKRWPFNVVDFHGSPRIQITVDGKKETFAPEEISASVLRSLKEAAEAYLGAPVKKAVITVPAYFNERQRQATQDAGKIAGLEVLGMINEPTAAAIAFGMDRVNSKKTVFIYDLGGGTFDVSIMTISGNKYDVLAHGGDTHLGGQDFDVRVMNHFIQDIRSRYGRNLEDDPEGMQLLRTTCELAKRRLAKLAEASISVFFPRLNFSYKNTLSRALFNDLCADLFEKTITITRKVIADAKLDTRSIDDVVLVGGSTRIVKIRDMLRSFFKDTEVRQSVNPDEAVALGAAVHAAALGGNRRAANQVVLKDVTPLSLGVDTLGGFFSVIIPRNTPVPCKKTQVYYNPFSFMTRVSTKVYQGERPMSVDNHYLNKEITISIPPKPANENKIDVTFKIDADGLLNVTCVERSTGEGCRVTVERQDAALDENEIQRMVKNAKRFKEEDEDKVRVAQDMVRKMRLH